MAAVEEGYARVSRLIAAAAECEQASHERVRAVLSAILVFFDEQPGWARLLLDEPPLATTAVRERRQGALRSLARALVNETQADENASGWFVPASELTAELIVGGVFSVLRSRMLEGRHEPYAELAPSLTAFVVARHPGCRAEPNAEHLGAGPANEYDARAERVPVRTTYRTTRVLNAIGDSPGLSNREIAEAAGLTDEGQTSKLLRRLEGRGLLENVGLGQACGGANAWLLTAYGERVLEATRHSLIPGAGAVRGRRVRGAA